MGAGTARVREKDVLCELDRGGATDAVRGACDDRDASFVNDGVHFVVHGRDGVVVGASWAERGGPAT